ncbi:uncharacterized protein LOC108671743 [Hyalella azteca]|uniref:Uncharacterized protein LOC108671743 n=1 Tax=Hyalella azteca TaxID=294128 RepID=A0A8B7NMA2_HYAAZ|nr:uncharacterized protein LOC108671743 [Hyalella azteca]
MNIWKGNTKKIKKERTATTSTASGSTPTTSAGPVLPGLGADESLPDVLAGHAMLAHQEHSTTRATSWQQQQIQQQHPQHEQHHASLYQPNQASSQQHYTHQQHIQYSNQAPSQVFPNQSLGTLQRGSHQQLQQPYTPLGLGAHGCEWRSDGTAYQDSTRSYPVQYAPSYQDADPCSRYTKPNCSYASHESDSKHRYYQLPSNAASESESHLNLRHYGNQPENADSRYASNYINPSDTDGRYLAIPVSDASTAFVPQTTLNVEDVRVSFNTLQVSDHASTARFRSMSSEPRGGRKDAENRRVRCSSANRVRQTRSRAFQPSSPSANSPLASPPQAISPPPLQITSPSSTCLSLVGIASPPPLASPVAVDQRHWDPCGPPPAAVALENPPEERNYSHHQPVSSSTGNYGYQVEDLEALLSHSSANQPANLPMVLASPTRLHHMRRTQTNAGPSRPFLPLGVIVNAVFKTRDWLYVRTAHGAEGFVPYHVCLPLGILPTKPSQSAAESQAPVAAWEMQETPVQRGRCRERRRAPLPASANQTDIQKLLPISRPSAPTPRDSGTQPQLQSYSQNHQASSSRN